MSGGDDAWFVYVVRRPGKVSAMPTGARGWLALLGFLAVTIPVLGVVIRVAGDWHPIAAVAIGLPLLTLAILGFIRFVVIPHGREETPR